MLLAIQYPAWIKPEIFPGIPYLSILRWYGLTYVLAFGTALLVFKKLAAEKALNTERYQVTEDDILSFFMYGIIGLLLGARILSTLVYDTTGLYTQKPWLIFWPFDENGVFTGLAGMSYHGGFIGGFLGLLFWSWRKKKPLFQWVDAMAVSIPLGYTFGRIGNFLNGELYGRITTVPWGMVFPYAERFSASLDWVKEFAEKAGIIIPAGTTLINLPRHPSQLYEAFFEGIILWCILWIFRKKKPFQGFLTSLYIIGYGFFRFIIEYFREPDAEIGYRISTQTNAPLYLNTSLFNLSTGQLFCLAMVGLGLILLLALAFRQKFAKKNGFQIPTKNNP